MITIQDISRARVRNIPLCAHVKFRQFGLTLIGKIVGISHGDPMRYDLRLENGAIVTNIPETAIGTVIERSENWVGVRAWTVRARTYRQGVR
ncbi:MAG TPA: hypothetical protein VNZ53_16330 [Steroidobacteraceae bacterium]|jgi:hypothetical protein|nr:hypothetical protein [Steroidobacteraceae bacterium]